MQLLRISLLLALPLVFLGIGCAPAGPGTQDASIVDPDPNDDDAGTPNDDAGATNDDAGAMNDDAGATNDDAGAVEADAGSDAGPVDPCAENNGGCDPLTTCTVTAGEASCSACPEGYTGDGLAGCVDVDECEASDDICGAAACANMPGSYGCFEPPVGVILFPGSTTGAVGDTDATPQPRSCPAGEVAIGYSFQTHASLFSKITAARSICSPLTLTETGPAEFSLTTTPPESPSSNQYLCPANEVVVGMSVYASDDVGSLTVQCATASVQLDPVTGFGVVTGEPHALARFPSESSPAPTATVMCPAGSVGAGETYYGGQWLFAYAMRCVQPDVSFNVPSISFGPTTDAPFVGPTSSTPEYTDLCPAGEIVTGIRLRSQWRAFGVDCGVPFFDLPLRVVVSPGTVLGAHGEVSPTLALGCPGNAGLSRFELTTFSNDSIIRLDLGCSTLTALETEPEWSVTVEAPQPGAHYGQLTAIDQVTECPAGTVAVGVQSRMTTQSNSYVTLSHLGLVCAAPQVP